MTVAPRSRRHDAVAPPSWVNDHDGAVPLPVAGGSAVSVGATGALRSSVKLAVLSAPWLSAMSVDRTRNVYAPSRSDVMSRDHGEVQSVQSTTTVAPRSSRQ